MKEKTYNLNTITHGIITISVVVLLYMLVNRLSGVLLPFLVSWIVAYLLHPLVSFFQYKCRFKSRGLSAFVAMLVVLLVVSGLVALLVPIASREMTTLSNYVTAYVADFDAHNYLPGQWQEQYDAFVANLNVDSLLGNEHVVALAKRLVPRVWGLVSGSMSLLSGLAVVFVCLLYVFFILLDYERMQQWSDYIPMKYRAAVKMLLGDLETNMNRYFRGQALVASIVGVLFAIGFAIVGLPMGVVMGLLIGVLNLVPYLQMAGIVPCLLLAILQSAETGRPFWVIFMGLFVVFLVVQLTQDLLLTPKIMGKATGLNPAVILLSLSVWGSLLGIVGMIIALPVTTILISYYKRFILGDETFAEEVTLEKETLDQEEEK